MIDMVGRTLGGYRIESLFAPSAAGSIYRASHATLPGIFAIKVIDSTASSLPNFSERFIDVVGTAAALHHPHILEIRDFGEEDGLCFVVTELCLHGSVRTLLQRARGTKQPVPLDLGLKLIEQAAEGLGYAHQREMVHGRLTPENLMLTSAVDTGTGAHWEVRIGDFGLAPLLSTLAPATGDGASEVFNYWSPEQSLELAIDSRSDLYSLGVILYELVASRPPFIARTVDEAIELHVGSEPPTPKTFRPDLPSSVDQIILRCLAKEPSARFSSAEEIAAALHAADSDESETVPRLSMNPEAEPVPPPVDDVLPDPDPTDPVDRELGTVSVSALADHVDVKPGEVSSILVSLGNTRNSNITTRIEAEPTPIARFPDLPIEHVIPAGAALTVPVRVEIDAARKVLAGEYRVHLQVDRGCGTPQIADLYVTLDVTPVPVEHVLLRSLGKRDRNHALFQVELINDGNTIDHYSLDASDDLNELRYRFSPEMVTVEPGETRTVVLVVSDRWRQARTDNVAFSVAAVPASGAPKFVQGEFIRGASSVTGVRQVVVGFGALGVIAVLLVVLLFGTVLRDNSANNALANHPTATPLMTPTSVLVAVATKAPTPTAQAPTPSPTPTQPAPTPTPTAAPTASPTVSPSGKPIVVRRIDTNTNDVALTFSISNDPGSAAKVTAILQALKSRNVTASFGIAGDWASSNPDTVNAILAGGNQLINETYDSRSFTGRSDQTNGLNSAQRISELTRAGDIIKKISGVNMQPYYRPPYGDIDTGGSSTVEADAAKAGYTVAVLWSIDTRSWLSSQTVGQMISDASAAQAGDVILFSISPVGGDKDIQALPQVIENIQAHGLGFATVKELVGR